MSCARPTITVCCERWKSAWEIRQGIVSFKGKSLGSDTLSTAEADVLDDDGAVDGDTDLVIENVEPNDTATTIDECDIAIGQAVELTLSAGTQGKIYRIRVRATTTEGQQLEGIIYLTVV